MKKIRVFYIFILTIVLVILSACQGNTAAPGAADETPDSTDTQQTVLSELPKTDREGNDIEVPAQITKVISLAPSTSQVIDALDLKDKLVAVDTLTPSFVTGLDSLPQYDMMAPDTESILSLEPDIVFVTGMSLVGSEDLFKPLKDLGVCVAVIPSSDSIGGIQDDIRFIADCLGVSEKGNSIVANMQTDIDEIAEIGKSITDKKTVMFEISALPSIYSFGEGVFLQEMLEIIGAENVFADQKSWISVTEESAVAANPDVILTSVNYIDDPVDEILKRNGWQNITAIKNKDVYYIENAASSLPNQHIIIALKQMAKYVYPDAYAKITES